MNMLLGVDALLVTDPTNIRYLTGFVGVDPRDRESYVLLTNEKLFLFTSALYVESAKELRTQNSMTKQLVVVEIGNDNPLSRALQKICTTNMRLGFEEVNLTVAEYTKLSTDLEGVTLIPTRNRVEELRQIKTEKEIANIRRASEITDECFSYILTLLKPGVIESDIAWEIETFFRGRGAESAFSPIVAFGKNSSMPHYNPNFSRPRLEAEANKAEAFNALQKQDIVLLDFGARFNGYCSDMTRVIFIGKPKQEWIDVYNAVAQAQQKALDLLSSGFYNGTTLDAAAKEVIAEANLPPYPHSLGHNLGLDIHEEPRLSTKFDQILKPNMAFTVEPGVYLEGKFGIRIEDTLVLTDKGIDVLTKSAKTIIVL